MRRMLVAGAVFVLALTVPSYGAQAKHDKNLRQQRQEDLPAVSEDQTRGATKLKAKALCQTVCYQELDENGDPMYDGQGNVMWDCRPDCPNNPDYQYSCAYGSYCTYVELCAHTPWGGNCGMTYGGGGTWVCGGC